MSIFYEKARELGELILKSDESLRLADAVAAYKKSKEAQEKMQEFNAYRQNVNESVQKGIMSKEDASVATKRLAEMSIELKMDEVIGELVTSENEFNGFVNNVLNILKATITGEDSSQTGCSGCQGCGDGSDCGSCR